MVQRGEGEEEEEEEQRGRAKRKVLAEEESRVRGRVCTEAAIGYQQRGWH